MTNCIVTARFIDIIHHLQKRKDFTSLRQFAKSIDFHPQCLNDILKGKRKVTIDVIRKMTETHQLNPNYIFSGQRPMFNKSGEAANDAPIVSVVVDKQNNEQIVHIPVKAQAGYTDQLHDPVYFQDLHTYSFPGYDLNHGSFRSFDIAGESMEPNLFHGDMVICRFVDPTILKKQLVDHFVYVIVTTDSIIVKRVINKLEEGFIECHSDNDFFDPIRIEQKDIKEMWEVKTKVSPFLQSKKNLRSGIHDQIDIMKETINEQSGSIKSLNMTIQKLLKIQRA